VPWPKQLREGLPQDHPRPVETCLHCRHGIPHNLGDFFGAEPFDVTQDEDEAILIRQEPNGALHDLPGFLGKQHGLRAP